VNCDHICQGLESLNAGLKSLGLHFRHCNVFGEDYARFFRALSTNETLEALTIGFDEDPDGDNASLIPACGASITDFLRTNRALKKLVLIGITDEDLPGALEALVAGLNHNRSLLHLSVQEDSDYDSFVPPELVPTVVDMLQRNTALHTLSGLSFPAEEPLSEQAEFLLKLNRFGRRFLATDLLPLGFWPVILANIAVNHGTTTAAHDVLFHFLKTRPGLSRSNITLTVAVPNDGDNNNND
jgi:hypothetical protein